MPDHLIVVGSGVTGVEFVHMFSSFGCEVTRVVSRQQVLPLKNPEVAAALEADSLRRGVHLYKGARAVGVDRDGDQVTVRCDDGRSATGSHVILAIGAVANSEGLGLANAGIETEGGYIPVDHHCHTAVLHSYAAGDLSQAAALVGRLHAGPQDRLARPGPHRRPPPPPPRLREGRLGGVHRA